MKTAPGQGGADASSRVALRVLIVEDSEDDALLLLRELERGGYELIHQRVDTPEAMRRTLAVSGLWDVVLSDWQMPRFSATEALAMLRETDPEVPFVIVSGKVGEEVAVEAMRSGAYDYVMKGNLTRLCATVERGLQEAEDRKERRRAEEERDRFFEFSLDLLVIAGLDGYFKRVNPAFEETLGCSSGELLAKPFIEFVHPEDRAATMSELEGLGRGAQTAYFENRYFRKDGSEVWLEWKAVPVVEEDVIYATARDVTERKRAEEELSRREAILRAVAFASERFLKKATSWEESIEEVLERLGEAAEASRVYIFENYRGEDSELWSTQRYEWVAKGVSSQMDNPLMQALPYRATGQGRWVELLSRGELVHGHTREFPEEEQPELRKQDILSIVIVPIFVEGGWWGIIGFDECFAEREWSAAEIDALKAAADTLGAAIQRERSEEAIRQSEQLYRTVIEQATEYISLVDVETKRIVGSNPAFREALGYTEEELRSMTLYDIVAHDRESIDANARRVIQRGRYFMGERKHRRKDGSLVDVEISASTVLHDGREVACIVGHDITERVEAFRLLEERITALARISASLTVGQTMEAALDALAVRVVRSTAAVACSGVLFNAETGVFRTAGSHGLPEGYTAGLEAAYRGGAPSAAMEVFRTCQPMLARDVRRFVLEDPLYAPIHRFVREAPWDTIYCVPLVYRGLALGSLNLYYPAGREPGEDEKVFLGAVADQTAVAVENARLFAEAQGKAALEERQRLARELHDSVSQALYGIILGSRTASTLLDREAPPERVAEWLEYVLSLAEAGMTEMRALIFELRPESLQSEGLIAALEQQAAALRARHEIPVHTTLCEEPDLPLETKEALYRIAQEALHNTVKHARASRADLKLECDARGIVLEVSDDGAGFDPEESFSGHLGLKSMRERAGRLGGTLRVESAPEEGTTIRARILRGT
jgi:PAS domain S-box-containing protein